MQAEPQAKTGSVSERVCGERSAVRGESRRSDKRFSVPGGVVRVRCKPFQVCGAEVDVRSMFFGIIPSPFQERCDLMNLSKGGLGFDCSFRVAPGTKLRMQLWVPGLDQPVEVAGEVRWCKRLLGRRYSVGVQFDPFGARSGLNPIAALEVLRTLEASHA